MGPPKWFGGDVTEGFAVGAQVNVAVPMLDASTDCECQRLRVRVEVNAASRLVLRRL